MTAPLRPSRRCRRRSALAVAALLAGCSAAENITCDEILTELDSIVRIEGGGADRRVSYAERAPVMSWYMRFWLLSPIRAPLGWIFGTRTEDELDPPAGHVRELLLELPDETGSDLLICAGAITRLAWLAEFETNAQTRVVAIDGLSRLVQQLELPLFAAEFERLAEPLAPQALLLARAGVQTGRPSVRPTSTWTEAQRRPYQEALQGLTSAPLAEPVARILLVQELTELRAEESDRALQPVADAALRAGIVHLVQGVLLRAVQGQAREYVELRLCAMEQIRRLGGPRTVPLLLAVMAASPTETASGQPLYDPDDLVRLRLIHYCGQLGGDLADAVVQLPGRADWQAQSPRYFLATTILNEQAYYSKLRTPALVALTWSLQRPSVDPDPAWVRRWRQGRAQ